MLLLYWKTGSITIADFLKKSILLPSHTFIIFLEIINFHYIHAAIVTPDFYCIIYMLIIPESESKL